MDRCPAPGDCQKGGYVFHYRPARRLNPAFAGFRLRARTPAKRLNLKLETLSITVRLMAEKFKCLVCGQEEGSCQCDKYCALCQGGHDVRLCQDGQYYCLDCREACDFQAQY